MLYCNGYITYKIIKLRIMDIKELIEKAVQLLKDARYSNSRIYTYRWLWSKGIIPFMKSRGLNDYNENVGKEFMLTCHINGELSFHHRDLVKSADVLTNALLRNAVVSRISFQNPYPLDGEIGNAAILFLEHLSKLRRKERTIRACRKRLSNFIEYLSEKGITRLSAISEEVVIDYVSSREYRQVEYVKALKRFLSFLFENELTIKDWSYTIKTLGKKFRRVRIPSFYTPEEIRLLENSISRKSMIGKRNYAMIMLCSRLGLRVSDVANLEFENIDWETNTIHIIQYKTGNPLSLPLLPAVGNAIIDYLQYGRKESDSKKVFLSFRPPYGEMTPNSVHSAIVQAFHGSGIDIKKRHHGGHALRFSLAQRMLDRSTPIPIISETLGHQEVDMTRTYVRIDFTHIRQCVLDVPEVSDDFYLQKGGCFYDE